MIKRTGEALELAAPAQAARAAFQAKNAQAAAYDLLDNVKKGKVKLEEIKKDELPEELQEVDASRSRRNIWTSWTRSGRTAQGSRWSSTRSAATSSPRSRRTTPARARPASTVRSSKSCASRPRSKDRVLSEFPARAPSPQRKQGRALTLACAAGSEDNCEPPGGTRPMSLTLYPTRRVAGRGWCRAHPGYPGPGRRREAGRHERPQGRGRLLPGHDRQHGRPDRRAPSRRSGRSATRSPAASRRPT